MQTVKLNWNDLDPLSREEICIGACISMKLASEPWEEIEPWLRELLAFSLEQRTWEKAALRDGSCVLSAPPVAKAAVADTMKSAL
jgi:hypothetical protein